MVNLKWILGEIEFIHMNVVSKIAHFWKKEKNQKKGKENLAEKSFRLPIGGQLSNVGQQTPFWYLGLQSSRI